MSNIACQLIYIFVQYSIVVICICIYVTGGCTGTLHELVGSHTKLASYPTLAIHCQRVVICASLDTRFKDDPGSDLPG